MKRMIPQLIEIQGNHEITRESDHAFLELIRQSLLLALQDLEP